MNKNAVIPAVRGFKDLEKAIAAPSDTIFLLEGEIIHLRNIVESVKKNKKKIYLHMDLIKGIKEDEASIHFLAKEIKVDGIISTRTSSLLFAKKYGLTTVQRGFLLDSHSLKTVVNTAINCKPDYIELLPSFSYPKLRHIKEETGTEVILGGFIDRTDELPMLFEAGAIAVSTSRPALWNWSKDSIN
ncbi:glycerol-3-phosphate responsive antiterminator [Effusibacillus lacus]|uniref:Glycerol uptake operon antiterminator regulatory protein n=1 Tax=Effusibacillus lacus TaxID=1348429 RepID=A0A292YIC9_9BACL|nr:glycerol-3-phosphate responsive antiterminator [Effusibacillus lacus]TCS74590.1 glycerol uptake operon antiterminator [Effusibacillus lacus]GAX88463.1 transcriptional regulator [Effusibacillus lacus]